MCPDGHGFDVQWVRTWWTVGGNMVERWGGWRTNGPLCLAFQAREGAEDHIFDATRRVLPSLLRRNKPVGSKNIST